MKAVIQRVSKASVTIEDKKVANILCGMLVLLGIEESDTQEDINWLSNKIINLRIFNDEKGIMNNSLLNCDGESNSSKVSLPCMHQQKRGIDPVILKLPNLK